MSGVLNRFFLVTLCFVLLSKAALACVSKETPQEALALSSHVFIGKVLSRNCEYDPEFKADIISTKFEIYDVWKGDVPHIFKINHYATNNCANLRWYYKNEEIYLVYARPSPLLRDKGMLIGFNMCGRTQTIPNYVKGNMRPKNADLIYLGIPIISYGDE